MFINTNVDLSGKIPKSKSSLNKINCWSPNKNDNNNMKINDKINVIVIFILCLLVSDNQLQVLVL